MKKNFYFAVIFLLLAMTSFAQGPVVYLPLDNDLNDASGNGLHAADSGAVATSFVDDPERGRVAFFDSAAHAALPKDDALRFGTGDFSFAMWLKIDRVGGDPAIFGNKDWGSGRNKGFVCYVKDADQMGSKNFGINFSDGPEDQGGSHNRLYWETFPNGGPDVIDGAWHFVAASFDRDDTLRVWVDGEQIYSEIDLTITPGMAHDDVNDYPIRLMEDGTGSYNDNGLAGYMDEVRVWNRTLTNEEVQELFAPEEEDEGPVVYLPLDNDLNDASGNGLHAADSGAVATTFVDDPFRGRVAFFEETAHAALPKDDALRFGTNDFAVALWLKIDRVGSDPAIISNKDWNNARNRGFVMYVDEALTPGEVNFGINLGDGKSEDGGSHTRFYWKAFENGAPDVIDGEWHSVAASFDRDGLLSVWIDGEPQYSVMDLSLAPGMAHDIVNDYPVRIMEDGTGKYNSIEVENGTEGLSGYIDEVRIWNRTVTDEEVEEFYLKVMDSVDKIQKESLGIRLYPNPTKGSVSLEFSAGKNGTAEIQIMNNQGALINEFSTPVISGRNKTDLSVYDWNTGVYLIRVISESNTETHRLIVTK
jgi:hypothetical protein